MQVRTIKHLSFHRHWDDYNKLKFKQAEVRFGENPHQRGGTIPKSLGATSVCDNMVRKRTSFVVRRILIWLSFFEYSMEAYEKNRTTLWSSDSIPGCLFHEHKNIIEKIHAQPLLITVPTAKIRKQPKYSITDNWLKKAQWYVCTHTYKHTHVHTCIQCTFIWSIQN